MLSLLPCTFLVCHCIPSFEWNDPWKPKQWKYSMVTLAILQCQSWSWPVWCYKPLHPDLCTSTQLWMWKPEMIQEHGHRVDPLVGDYWSPSGPVPSSDAISIGIQELSQGTRTDGQFKFFSPTMLWTLSMLFPYFLTGITPAPLSLGTIKIIHSLVGKASGIGMAFQLAEITILGSSKMALVSARHWRCRMTARCNILVLAHIRSIMTWVWSCRNYWWLQRQLMLRQQRLCSLWRQCEGLGLSKWTLGQ